MQEYAVPLSPHFLHYLFMYFYGCSIAFFSGIRLYSANESRNITVVQLACFVFIHLCIMIKSSSVFFISRFYHVYNKTAGQKTVPNFNRAKRTRRRVLFIAYNFAYSGKYRCTFFRCVVELLISNGPFATLSIAPINLSSTE